MKLSLLFLAALVLVSAAWGHPHEWVDWGVGVTVDDSRPRKLVSARLELTWDEWYSALIVTDFPGLQKNSLGPGDLPQLDAAYGLASPDRAVNVFVTFAGKPVPVKRVVESPRYDGKQATLIYTVPLGFLIEEPAELRVEIYDPTYYTDMGIRAKAGGYFVGKASPAVGSVRFEQDASHAYYGGSVVPEVVVFSLKP